MTGVGSQASLHGRDDDALLTLAFAIYSNPGAYAILVAAGVSAPSMKTAWRVLEELCAKAARTMGQDPGSDPVRWYENHYKEKADYSSVIARFALTPIERQKLLEEQFEASPEEREAGLKQPTAAHRAIAGLVRSGYVRVILTLNFDRLLEQALREDGIEPTVIVSPAGIKGMAPLHTLQCCVIHLHGDFRNPSSMLNTSDELDGYDRSTQKLLNRVLKDYGLVIAGWSASYDHALRRAIG